MLCTHAQSPSRSKTKTERNASSPQQKAPTAEERLEQEYQALLAMDDAAQEEVERWIKENVAFEAKGAGLQRMTLQARVEDRLKPVRKAYEDFLRRNPKHARARIAFGSFLNERGEEDEARSQWERARDLDPKNPAVWNNLGNYYGHRGPVKKAFECYAKAIELNPNESIYYQNLGTTVFLFRTDSKEFYKLTEQEVFDKALELYRKALELSPNDFALASDVAQTYYGIKPPRTQDALAAWETALRLAADDIQREGIYIHLARVNMIAGHFDLARDHLAKVQHEQYAPLKQRVARSIEERQNGANTATPAPPSESPTTPQRIRTDSPP